MADKKEGAIPDFLNRTGVEFRKSEGGHLDFEYVELRRFSKWGFSVYCQIHYASPGGQALTIIATPMQEFDSGLRTQILELANQVNHQYVQMGNAFQVHLGSILSYLKQHTSQLLI